MHRKTVKIFVFIMVCILTSLSFYGCKTPKFNAYQSPIVKSTDAQAVPTSTVNTPIPTTTPFIDYDNRPNILIDTNAILSAIRDYEDGKALDNKSDFYFIFNRYFISQLADTSQMKGIVLDFYLSILTSQPRYEFPEHSNITSDKLNVLFSIVQAEAPELLHLNDSYQYYTDDNNIVSSIDFNYTHEPDEYYSMLLILFNIIDSWKEEAYSLDDFHKELYVYNQIIDNCSYTKEGDEISNAYGAIVNGKALCQGYSNALTLGMFCMNMECARVNGDSKTSKDTLEKHVWNYVNINGNWYLTDITWDDADEFDTYYPYMNITDTEMSRNHYVSEMYSSFDLPECTSIEMNYYSIYDYLIPSGGNLKEYFFKILDKNLPDGSQKSYSISFKFKSESDYNKLMDSLSSWLEKWNGTRSESYISFYHYTYDSTMYVVRFNFDLKIIGT